MSLPKWVIDNTFNALRHRKQLVTELQLDLDKIRTRLEGAASSSGMSLRASTFENLGAGGRQSKRTKKMSRLEFKFSAVVAILRSGLAHYFSRGFHSFKSLKTPKNR